MVHLPFPTANKSADYGVLRRRFRPLPLLQFDNDRSPLIVFPGAGDDKVDPLTSLGDVEFDRHTGVLGDVGVFQDSAHVGKGVPP